MLPPKISTFPQPIYLLLGLPAICILLLASCSPKESTPPASEPSSTRIGGPCDGCELMYMGMPAYTELTARDTSSGWHEGKRRLVIGGQVWNPDSLSPAPGVLLYFWHTDENGLYAPREGMDQRAARHGHLRGWVKTDALGRWAIVTSRPAPYPDRDEPAHIHILVKEEGLENEYYIDALVFSDDPLLIPAKRAALERRGGNPILRIENAGSAQVAEHHIVLGRNIPGYPQAPN